MFPNLRLMGTEWLWGILFPQHFYNIHNHKEEPGTELSLIPSPPAWRQRALHGLDNTSNRLNSRLVCQAAQDEGKLTATQQQRKHLRLRELNVNERQSFFSVVEQLAPL